LRFNSADSASLTKNFSSAGNRKTWTLSFWTKRCFNSSFYQSYFINRDNAGYNLRINDPNSNTFYLATASGVTGLTSSAVYRDFSAWMHVVIVYDSTDSTSTDRVRLYVNGERQTFSSGSYPSLNLDSEFNNSGNHGIGYFNSNTALDAYLADYHFIDGVSGLTATDFGELDDSKVWQPIKYAGTYGTNGFHLDFSDTSSNSALGTDSSGAGNNWSVNNLTAADGNAAIYTNAVTTTEASGVFYGGTVPANLFSASTLLYGGYNSSNGNSNIIWTPPGGIAVNNPKITLSYYSAVKINGTAYTPTGSGELTIPFVGTLNTLLLENTDGSHTVVRAYGLKPDGTNLVTLIDGVNNDALRDTPVNGDSANDTGAGGEITGNYCTWNPLGELTGGYVRVLANGNLEAKGGGDSIGTITFGSGKTYFELTITAASAFSQGYYGIVDTKQGGNRAWNATAIAALRDTGSLYGASSTGSAPAAAAVGTIYGFAVDVDNQKMFISVNGTWLNSGNPASSTGASFTGRDFSDYAPLASLSSGNAQTITLNAGQRAFAYAAPSGYKALCTANRSDPLIADGSTAFDAKLWTGNGGTQAVTGYNFSPDLVWTKQRNHTGFHALFDQIRGVHNAIRSNTTGGTYTDNGLLTAFNSDGFSLGSAGDINGSSSSYVGWAWDAGENSNKTYAVTVSNPGSGNKFYADGALQPTLTLAEGSTYKFDQSSGTNSTHPLRFSTTSDGTHGGGSQYTTGVTTSGTPGSAGAYTQIVIAASAPTLYAYCTAHSGMGFQINTSDTAGYTIPVGGENSALYDQSQTWSNALTCNVGFHSAYPVTKAFDGTFQGNGGAASATDSSPTFTFTPPASITVTSIEFNCYTSCTLTLPDGSTQTIAGVTTNNTDVAASIGSGFTFTGSNSITLSRTSGHLYLERMKINGKELVDSGVSLTSVPSISSRVQVDPSKGFSITKFTAASSMNWAHGLNAAPDFVIMKSLSTGAWYTYHSGASDKLFMLDSASVLNGTYFTVNSSTVSASSLYPGVAQDITAYCFAPVSGYSAFGSYLGNGSADGPMVHTGFRPAFILLKSSTTSRNWHMFDTKRDVDNLAEYGLYPNLSSAESNVWFADINSNGFKIRTTNDAINGSGVTYVYYAVAEHPFKTARAR
jgi:hypothetical protein